MADSRNSRIMVIPDLHLPYAHPDLVRFLGELKRRCRPTRVILLGDEVDNHAISFHPSDPDLRSSGDELEAAISGLQPLYQLFPHADVMESNHGSLAYRKSLYHGLSRRYMRSYREVLKAPSGWRWHASLTLTSGSSRIFFHHGIAKDVMKVVNRRGINVVQGHFHSEYGIWYSGNPDRDLWGMSAGCLIDPASSAFSYNANQLERPILGAGCIVDGHPSLYKLGAL